MNYITIAKGVCVYLIDMPDLYTLSYSTLFSNHSFLWIQETRWQRPTCQPPAHSRLFTFKKLSLSLFCVIGSRLTNDTGEFTWPKKIGLLADAQCYLTICFNGMRQCCSPTKINWLSDVFFVCFFLFLNASFASFTFVCIKKTKTKYKNAYKLALYAVASDWPERIRKHLKSDNNARFPTDAADEWKMNIRLLPKCAGISPWHQSFNHSLPCGPPPTFPRCKNERGAAARRESKSWRSVLIPDFLWHCSLHLFFVLLLLSFLC